MDFNYPIHFCRKSVLNQTRVIFFRTVYIFRTVKDEKSVTYFMFAFSM